MTEQDLADIKEYIIYSVLLLMLAYNKEKSKNIKDVFKLQNIFEEGYDLLVTEMERDFIRLKRYKPRSTLNRKQPQPKECMSFRNAEVTTASFICGQTT